MFATLTDNKIFEQTETTYDGAGNVTLSRFRQRWHNATGTGALAGPSTQPKSRDSFTYHWYDGLSRPKTTADYGTNQLKGAGINSSCATSSFCIP